jgi:LysM repeat protein
MKNILLLFLLNIFFCTSQANAQEIKYTTHTITKGETLSQLAQKYHTSVGDIMRLNNMNSKSQLKIGEKIKIPSSSSTTQRTTEPKASSKTNTTSPDTTIAIHYVWNDETLYSISKKFGVTVEQLKEWNNLPDENIHFGQQLAVRPEGVKLLAIGNEKTNAVTTNTTSAPVATSNVNPDSSNNILQPDSSNKNASADSSNSYFAKEFSSDNKNLKSVVGYGTIFKSANGWQDKKYYILMNGAQPGTIVKVSTPDGNSIYAKVLWALDTTSRHHLNFSINDAAASALAVNEQTFSLRVEYHE